MAKKFVRGITDIKNIEHQDFDTNNVNDLLSDGQNNYIHRKKGNSEEYHNLTNNIKTIQSDNTDLLTVTNYNNTTNSATIRPKHDSQKEQLLESTDETIIISHGENGTEETTTVDVNPAKVLQHDNLQTSYGISKTKNGNRLTLGIEYTRVSDGFDLNTLQNGNVRAGSFINAPQENTWFFVSAMSEFQHTIQRAINLVDTNNTAYIREKRDNIWGEWREQVGDKSVIDNSLAQKQNTLTSNTSIGVDGNGLTQLYTLSQTYIHANGFLQTHVKSIANNASVSTHEEEFNLRFKIHKGKTTATFSLNEHDKQAFAYLLGGTDGTIDINGVVCSLSGSSLTVQTNNATNHTYITSSSCIMSAINVTS